MQCEKLYSLWTYLCTDFFKSTQVGVCNNMRHLGEGGLEMAEGFMEFLIRACECVTLRFLN